MTHPGLSIDGFHDPQTGTVSYVVADAATGCAAIIDPVLDFDGPSGRTSGASAQRLMDHVNARGLSVEWILETHAHADHLSAARHLQDRVGGRIGIGRNIREVQRHFSGIYNLDPGEFPEGGHFDRLLGEGDEIRIGQSVATVLEVPGHTPADVAYRIGDAVFAGDTLFMPDVGTARADFPGGDASALYRSIRRLLDLPPATRIFVCHDYPRDREPRWACTVAEQRAGNIHVRDGIGEDRFVAMRAARDAVLKLPALMLPSLQVNIRGGRLPPADGNGIAYLRIPLNIFAAPA
ncbi:MAG: MBL fold metallo-hydrolase [Variovorax sp.]|nr:MBL fold metallo-hydrolase [Variovorax sp.]